MPDTHTAHTYAYLLVITHNFHSQHMHIAQTLIVSQFLKKCFFHVLSFGTVPWTTGSENTNKERTDHKNSKKGSKEQKKHRD